MKDLNKHTINIRGLNLRDLNGTKYAPKSVAWKGYCQDGLVFQIDCTQQPTIDGSTATLKDLASGIVLSGESEGIWKNDDGTLSIVGFTNETSKLLSVDGQKFMIEAFYRSDEEGSFDINTSFQTTKVNYSMYYGKGSGSTSGGYYACANGVGGWFVLPVQIDKAISLSGFSYGSNERTYYTNGESQSYSVNTNTSERTGINIGTLDKIYSFRIYNRILTDAERLHNYTIDKMRFDPIPANALADDNGNLLYDDSGNLLLSDN